MSHECRHIMPNGAKCQSPALRDKPYCYFHTRLHRFTAGPIGVMESLRLPVLEDRSAIQIASQNVERKFDIIPSSTVESITLTDTGEELGPVEHICDPDDCATCADRGTCEDYEPEEDEQED